MSKLVRSALICYLFSVCSFVLHAQVWTKQDKLFPDQQLTNKGDRYGTSIDVYGNIAAVSAVYDSEAAIEGGAVYLYEWNGSSWDEIAKISPSDAVQGMDFGTSVALSADLLVVGAQYDDQEGDNKGSAYVFEKPAGGWSALSTESCKLIPAEATSDIYSFGFSVAIEGDVVVVGKPFSSGLEGTIYVYEMPVTGWSGKLTETAKLTYSGSQLLGYSVAISNGTIAAGAPSLFSDGLVCFFPEPDSGWEDAEGLFALSGTSSEGLGISLEMNDDVLVTSSQSNRVYVYTRSGDTWTSSATKIELTPSDPTTVNDFGASVALDHDYVIVGDPENANSNTNEGAVYLYKKPAAGWSAANETAKLTTAVAASFTGLGAVVAISNGHILSANPDYNGNTGVTFAFEKPLTEWVSSTETESFNSSPHLKNYSDWFGHAIAVDGSVAVVRSSSNGGEVYVLENDGSGWKKTAKLNASDQEEDDNFGFSSIDISGDVVVIGSSGDDDNGDGSGSAYLFEKPLSGWEDMTETVKIKPSDGATRDRFGCAVAIDGDHLVIGSKEDDEIISGSGSAYIFEKPATGWADLNSESARLNASDAGNNDLFGGFLDISGDVVVVGAYWNDDNGSSSGSAYIFEKPSTGWVNATENAKLLPSSGASGDYFGIRVKINGGLVLISASGDDSGTVFLYEEPSTGWTNSTEDAILTPSSADGFGVSLAIDADRVFIGSQTNVSTGGVFFYDKPTGGWSSMTETGIILPAEATSQDLFGNTLASNGSELLIGATGDDDQGSSAGAVYSYVFGPNQAPSFTLGENQTILEDADSQTISGWATSISDGEGGLQELTFSLSNDNNNLFSIQPSIDSVSGDLTFEAATNANGSATVTVSLSDNGGIESGGVDTSEEVTFTIAVTAVNDAPVFDTGGSVTVLEDAGEITITEWASGISPGEFESQLLEFELSGDNTELFSVQPSISPTTGDLTFTTADGASGSTIFSIILKDDGGTDNGGSDQSDEHSVLISVTSVNDAPTFKAGADVSILEDAGAQTLSAWATEISDGDNGTQNLTFRLTGIESSLFDIQPSIDPNTGDLTFTSASNASGTLTISLYLQDDGGTSNNGIDHSETVTFDLTIEAINDAPSFTQGSDQEVAENVGEQTVSSWATDLDDGDDGSQQLSFEVSNDNNDLFETQPAIDASGNLTYEPVVNGVGSATVTVILTDNGGTANGGIDVSEESTFTISVVAINHAPAFVAGGDVTTYENSGAQTLTGWATSINDGDDGDQTLTFDVTNDNTALFTVQPSIDSVTGDLSFNVASEAVGTATVTITLKDDGGTAFGGSDTSDESSFTITVLGINHAPSFTPGPDQVVLEDAGAQSISGWATEISDSNDGSQAVAFHVTNDNNQLFTSQPSVNTSGDLTFTAAANANGTAIISISLSDDGGTENGGSDSSEEFTFSITVLAVNDQPSFSAGLDQIVDENSGSHTISNWAAEISDGDAGNQMLTFAISSDNDLLFSELPAIDVVTGDLTFTTATNVTGEAVIMINLMDDGGTSNGGIDTSDTVLFTITVNPIDDLPSFIVGPDQTILEDAGLQLIEEWASRISSGDDSSDDLSFSVSSDNTALFETQPSVDADGNLSYKPAANASGDANVSLRLLRGNQSSETATFSISVLEVNDAPEFSKGNDVVVSEDAGSQTLSGWATGMSDGDAESQTLSFTLSSDNEDLFSIQPDLSAETGDLTFTLAENATGKVQVFILLIDDGGSENGGINESLTQSFTITIDPVNDAPFDLVLVGNSIEENQPAGTKIGDIAVQDIDSDEHTFNLTGVGAERFEIIGSELFSTVQFDFETKASYSLSLVASDNNVTNPLSTSIDIEIAIVDVDEPAFILDTHQNTLISIYPNPAKELLIVDLGDGQSVPTKLSLIDLSGREVISQNSSNTLSIETIPSGNYLLRVIDENKVFTSKISIKH